MSNRINEVKIITGYLKMKIKTAAILAFACGVFAFVFYLYRLPVGAVLYAAVVLAFFGLVYVLIDYMEFRKKHLLLMRLQDEISISIDKLPKCSQCIETDYQNIIRELNAFQIRTAEDLTLKYNELIDYYTLWAHQIKTPIAAMMLILQNTDSDDSRELFGELQKIEQYVEMVLCYLRLNSDSTDYVIRKYDLDKIVKQSVRKYASQFIRKRINLNYQPVSCTVLTDEKWLLFVIDQVISNSLKYTKSGDITITIEEHKTLCIADTGIGIAAEDIPRVCEKGFTGYNGRNDKKASGIGLYLCKQILTKLGHKISIASEVGKGTEVRIMLESTDLTVE